MRGVIAMGAASPGMRTLSTEVAGVSYGDRQQVIRKHCREGDRLRLRRDRRNRHSKHATEVWTPKHGYFSRGWRMIGYLPDDDAAKVAEMLSEGWKVEAFIRKVVGGRDGLLYGLRIEVDLHPPLKLAAVVTEAGAPDLSDQAAPTPRFRLPAIPERTRRQLRTAADFAIHRLGPYVACGWIVCLLFGRPFDLAGVAVVAALIYAGRWAIRRVLEMGREKPPSG